MQNTYPFHEVRLQSCRNFSDIDDCKLDSTVIENDKKTDFAGIVLPITWLCRIFVFPTAMRLSLWIGLFCAFSVGMGCALVLRAVFFEAEPVVFQEPEPTTQILVATRTIPSGVEINGSFVAFQDVAISEVPAGAFDNFNHAFRRQPAFPIPAGCPICEELLVPLSESYTQGAFVPPGRQFVALDVAGIRYGHRVLPLTETLETVLDPDQRNDIRVDIRFVPRNETPGRLAEIRNQVLQTFGSYDARNSGEIILENVPIHRIQRRPFVDHTGTSADSLELLLDRDDAAKLAAAARMGEIRVTTRQHGATSPPMLERGNFIEVAQQPRTQHDMVGHPVPQQSPAEVPFTQEQQPVVQPPPAPTTTTDDIFSRTVHAENVHNIIAMSGSLKTNDGNISTPGDGTMISFGTLPQHIAPAEQSLEPNAAQQDDLPLAIEPNQGAQSRDDSEVSIIGNPRISQSIQFVVPGSVPSETALSGISLPDSGVSAQELRQEVVEQPEIAASIAASLPKASTSFPARERAEGPEFSPFERRAFTVQSGSVGNSYSEEPYSWGSSGSTLSTPPLLQRSL